MITDQDKLNDMLASAGMLKKEIQYEDWFTRGHQKQIIFNLAAKMFCEHPYEDIEDDREQAEACIEAAETFVNAFYRMKVDPKTRS